MCDANRLNVDGDLGALLGLTKTVAELCDAVAALQQKIVIQSAEDIPDGVMKITAQNWIQLTEGLREYPGDTEALAGGLPGGALYRTPEGFVRIVVPQKTANEEIS